jgi:hypothetical protein
MLGEHALRFRAGLLVMRIELLIVTNDVSRRDRETHLRFSRRGINRWIDAIYFERPGGSSPPQKFFCGTTQKVA